MPTLCLQDARSTVSCMGQYSYQGTFQDKIAPQYLRMAFATYQAKA